MIHNLSLFIQCFFLYFVYLHFTSDWFLSLFVFSLGLVGQMWHVCVCVCLCPFLSFVFTAETSFPLCLLVCFVLIVICSGTSLARISTCYCVSHGEEPTDPNAAASVSSACRKKCNFYSLSAYFEKENFGKGDKASHNVMTFTSFFPLTGLADSHQQGVSPSKLFQQHIRAD